MMDIRKIKPRYGRSPESLREELATGWGFIDGLLVGFILGIIVGIIVIVRYY